MIEYLWGERLRSSELREAATGLFQQADNLNWDSLVAPFVRYEPLAESRAHVDTVVMRLANLVAKCDGQTMPGESIALHSLQKQIEAALYPSDRLSPAFSSSGQRQQSAPQIEQQPSHSAGPRPAQPTDQQRQQRLESALEELSSLIGLEEVKTACSKLYEFSETPATTTAIGIEYHAHQFAYAFCW